MPQFFTFSVDSLLSFLLKSIDSNKVFCRFQSLPVDFSTNIMFRTLSKAKELGEEEVVFIIDTQIPSSPFIIRGKQNQTLIFSNIHSVFKQKKNAV